MDEISDDSSQKVSKVVIPKTNFLSNSSNVYQNLVVRTEKTVGLSALKPNALTQQNTVLKTNFEPNNFEILINDKEISISGNSKTIESLENEIFGSNVSLQLNGRGQNKGKSVKSGKIYIPLKISITNPRIETEKDLFPYCYYEDFILEWNADPNNEEGLLVIAQYTGKTAVPDYANESPVTNTDFIENDSGRAVLKNELFDGMPNTAIVNIILLRGNVQIFEEDGEIHKFYAESHEILPIILIKDLDILE
ncbi:MAG: hypothetical protein CMH48_03155 [Muricauda sp.]|nr:hypothetical protein [Allomuricauda sp.]MBC29820.1 hypothetical protein [Allomuricauda sp.]